MLIQLVVDIIHSDNGCTLSSDNGGTGHLSKVTSRKLKKLIQPVLIQLVRHSHHSDNDSILSKDNCGTGYPSKVASSKLKKLIQPVLIHLVDHRDNVGTLN